MSKPKIPPPCEPESWSPAAKFFHWTTALIILVMFALGWIAESYPMSPTKIELFNLHKSLGLLVLAWVLARLAWRACHASPALPTDLSRAERRAARLSHTVLYVLMIVMPLSGWMINSAADFPLKWFGLFPVPSLAPPDEGLQDAAESVHLILFWTMLAVVMLHAAAALHHHFVRRNNVLTRMLPFTGRDA